jgi:cytochrome c oxidase cbb3-type subunit III
MADKNPFPGENNTGHVWDGNLRELKNPPPRWWTIAFWASVIWWIGYSIIYPMWPIGQEATQGVTGWTQIKEYQEGLEQIEAVRAPYESRIDEMSAKEILADDELREYTRASSRVLFGDYCAACHGAGGAGGPNFPVLADDDWLYGGSVETIVQTLTNGRKGVMPSHGKVLSAEQIDQLAAYVVGLSEGKEDEAGKELYMSSGCLACHGMDAKGMQALGSANLTDAIWRFNESDRLASARYTIAHGVNDPSDPKTREAVMPAFGERLSKDEIKKLAVYVHTLGGGQ